MSRRSPNDLTASLHHERRLAEQGYQAIGGVDEAGRGPWAGPLVAAIVVLPLANLILPQVLQGVRDSKQMTAKRRAVAAERIQEVALAWGVGMVSAADLGDIGHMTKATIVAYQRAYDDLKARARHAVPDFLLIDYFAWESSPAPCLSLVHGDQQSLSIAAASVLAKTHRDAYMLKLAKDHPRYGFEAHKGYGTAKHRAALLEHGPCSEHRMTYRPVMEAQAKRFPDL
ncbi:MAG: ribonuclease HII [Anaerolineae bacterium]|nr:ribonuclease HII [Anaerolineae bacterium]MDW8173663.1 ribonuclease HII [Anaerolineae bacterium]